MLDLGTLTIGFARRFATYKRAGLIFTDMDRISRLLWNEDRPVQIIFAGKAHPADRPGQGVIQEIFSPLALAAAARSGLHSRGLRHARRPLHGPGRGRVAQQPAPAAGGLGHERHEGRQQRRRQPVRAGRLVGRGLYRRQRLGHRRPGDESGRWRAGPGRFAGPLPAARGRSGAALLRPQRGRRSGGLDRPDAAFHRQHDLAVLHDPDAPRVRRADVPPRGRHRPRRARGPASQNASPASGPPGGREAG